MVSRIPPNHSKPNDEPVTLDLEAEKTAQDAAPEDMTRPGRGELGGSPADDMKKPLETGFETDREPLREESQEPPARETLEEPQTAAQQADPAPSHTEPSPQPAFSGGSTSGLIAAGIVGGLIALVGAGALQYAGFLPGGRAARNSSADIAALNAEIDGLKQSVANLAAAPAAKPDETFAARVAALETSAANGASAGGSGGAANPASDQRIASLTGEVEQLKADLGKATRSQATSDAEVSKRLDDAEKKLSGPSQESAVARAIAAAALKAAIDRGGPFRPELDTFANVAPDDPAVADLRNFAQTGVPSRADLIRQVSDVATAIAATAQADDPNQSWSSRLMSGAKSLVQVRPVGNVPGDSIDAIAARFEDKVKNGDLPGALTEWNSLPDAAKSASAAFKQSLEARIRVEDLVSDALSKAIANTGKQN